MSGASRQQERAVADLRQARTATSGWRDAQRATFDRAHLDRLERAGRSHASALAALEEAIARAERAVATG